MNQLPHETHLVFDLVCLQVTPVKAAIIKICRIQFNGMIKQGKDVLKIQLPLVNVQIPVSFYTISYIKK